MGDIVNVSTSYVVNDHPTSPRSPFHTAIRHKAIRRLLDCGLVRFFVADGQVVRCRSSRQITESGFERISLFQEYIDGKQG